MASGHLRRIGADKGGHWEVADCKSMKKNRMEVEMCHIDRCCMLVLCALTVFHASATPTRLASLNLPSAEKLAQAESQIGSWVGWPSLPASGFSRYVLSLPMVRALGSLRKGSQMSIQWFLDSEIVKKYPGDKWSEPQMAVVCEIKWTRDDFLKEYSNAVFTNGMLRLENAQGRTCIDDYWYVEFSPDGSLASVGASPEMARAAFKAVPSNAVPDGVVAELHVSPEGVRRWGMWMFEESPTNRMSRTSEVHAKLIIDPDGLRISESLSVADGRDCLDSRCARIGDSPLAFAPKNALVAFALTCDVDVGLFEFCDAEACLAVLRDAGIDVSSVKVSEGVDGACNCSYGPAFALQCLGRFFGLFGEDKDTDLVEKIKGVKRVEGNGGRNVPIMYSMSIEGCESGSPPSVRFKALFPQFVEDGWHGVGFIDAYTVLQAVLCECVSKEDSSLRCVLQPAIDAMPPAGGGIAWLRRDSGGNMTWEAKVSASELKGLVSWWSVYSALVQLKAEKRTREDELHGQENPVDVAERLVSCGDLTGAVKALERAPTNDCRVCCAVGDFYGTHPMLPARRIERINCWMDRAYQLADEGDKRQIAGRCASGFEFGDHGYPKDDESTRLWLQRAADSGSAYWQCMLADSYANAFNGFKRDGAKALKYLEMAERQKHLKTHHVRADMYENGVGLPKDPKKAMECLEEGMKRGSRVCRERYAAKLIGGRGGDGRRAEGCDMMRRILARGEADTPGYCLANLGFAYENGYGVKKDVDMAVEYYKQGAAHGNGFSQRRLKALEKQ